MKAISGCILLLLLLPAVLRGQSKGAAADVADKQTFKGQTFALIVGISDYENPSIHDLNFAEADARAFADYLKSKSGGSVPEKNIISLYNSSATRSFIFTKGLRVLEEKVLETKEIKAGDRVILYFSGHGGAFNSQTRDNAYFICYDANSQTDGNLNLKISQIKDKIHTIVEENVQVIFIFDACRTIETVGIKEGIQYVNKIIEEPKGEILLTASTGGKPAYESRKIGHGVFTYFLLRGLYGEAEGQTGDGKISGRELENYLEEKVSEFSRNEFKDEQLPFFIWGESSANFKGRELFQYDAQEGKIEIASMEIKNGSMAGGIAMASNSAGKGKSKGSGQSIEDYKLMFDQAMKEKRLIRPKNDCAYWYCQKMLDFKSAELKASAIDFRSMWTDLSLELMGVASTVISEDLMGLRKYYRPKNSVKSSSDTVAEDKSKMTKAELREAKREAQDAKDFAAWEEYADPLTEGGVSGQEIDYDYYTYPVAAMDAYSRLVPYGKQDPAFYSMWAYLTGRETAIQPGWDVKQETTILRKAIRSYPDQAYLYFALGQLYRKLADEEPKKSEQRYQESNSALRQAIKLSPLWTYPWITIADNYESMDLSDSAAWVITQLLSLNTGKMNDFVGAYQIASLLEGQEKLVEAKSFYYQSVKSNPRVDYVWLALGNLHVKSKEYDSAVFCFKKYAQLNPADSYPLRKLAETMLAADQYDSSIFYFKKALKLGGKEKDIYQDLASAYSDAHKYDSSIYYYHKFLRVKPKSPGAYYRLSQVYTAVKKYDSAIYCGRIMFELDSNYRSHYANIYANMGAWQGGRESASKYYYKAIAIDPTYAYSYRNLASNHRSRNMYDSAIFYNLKFLRYSKQTDSDVLGNLGKDYLRLGNFDKAKEYFEKYHDAIKDGSKGEYEFFMASWYGAQNQMDECLKQLEASFKNGYSWSVTFDYGFQRWISPILKKDKRLADLINKR